MDPIREGMKDTELYNYCLEEAGRVFSSEYLPTKTVDVDLARAFACILYDNLSKKYSNLCVDYARAEGQITQLATFIMSSVPGYPNHSEGAVDTAIRIIREQQERLDTNCPLCGRK